MSDPAYQRRAGKMDEAYRDAFAALSPALRSALQKRGIKGPETINHESSQGPRDVSEFTDLAAPRPEITDAQRRADELAERFDLSPKAAAEMLIWIEEEIEREAAQRKAEGLAAAAGILINAANVTVSAYALAFACEMNSLDIAQCPSMRAAAKKIGCSTAYISALANQYCDLLCLPRPKGMKSAQARTSYQTARKGNHWRKQKCPQK
jgi:hypothetical protein